MLDKLLMAVGEYKWMILASVLITVLFSALILMKADMFSWEKGTLRTFAVLYDLDTRGLICFTIMFSRLIFILYLCVTGGSEEFSEAVVIILMTIVYAIISHRPSNFIHIITYAAIYALLLMERLFLQYYRNVESGFTIIFMVIAFGLFAALYSIHQFITGYEKLIGECAVRDINKYEKDSKKNGNIRKNKFGLKSKSRPGTETEDKSQEETE